MASPLREPGFSRLVRQKLQRNSQAAALGGTRDRIAVSLPSEAMLDNHPIGGAPYVCQNPGLILARWEQAIDLLITRGDEVAVVDLTVRNRPSHPVEGRTRVGPAVRIPFAPAESPSRGNSPPQCQEAGLQSTICPPIVGITPPEDLVPSELPVWNSMSAYQRNTRGCGDSHGFGSPGRQKRSVPLVSTIAMAGV